MAKKKQANTGPTISTFGTGGLGPGGAGGSTITTSGPTVMPSGMVSGEELQTLLGSNGAGFDRIERVDGTSYKDCSTIIIVPERSPMFHQRVVQSWQNMIAPMNQKRAFIYVIGDEVGKAYTNTIQQILKDPNLSKWKYIMTLESDNIQPPDAQIRLIESIEKFGLDGVSGIYFTKGDFNMPMAYGNPEEYRRTGILDFKPLDIRDALGKGQVIEVNGIAMGCSLYRMELFRQIEAPWFVTVADIIEGKGAQGFTQDLYFCQKAKLAGKRFGVDLRVRVGHLDVNTGIVY